MKRILKIFDKEDVFNKKCKEKLDELIELLEEEQIPCFFSIAVKNDDKGTKYINSGVMTGSNAINLKDDQIKRHLAVAAGFITVPKQQEVVMDSDFLAE